MDASKIKVWLPFDDSPTFDRCGNTWTAVGNPTISETDAIKGNALQLDGASYIQSDIAPVELFNSDFTIHFYMTYRDSKTSEGGFFTHSSNFAWQCYASKARFNANCTINGQRKWLEIDSANLSEFKNSRHHFAIVRKGNTLYFFFDGQLKTTYTVGTFTGSGSTLQIGARSNYRTAMTIDEFMIHSEALWTENFTPPTAQDYEEIPLFLVFDVERKVKNAAKTWRYENAGTADTLITRADTLTDLPIEQSVTGKAFYQLDREKCFDIPVTTEIWIKFDVYFDGSNRWRAYNDKDGEICGVCSYTNYSNGDFGMWQNNNRVQDWLGICKKNQLQTVLLHMVSGSTDGVIEAWVDGNFIYRYSGDVNHGEDFADIYLQSDGSGTFFSNVIISNAEIKLGEGWHAISFDAERQVQKKMAIVYDVERQVKNVMELAFTADVVITDILPVSFVADIVRDVQKTIELDFDVELEDVIPVEFTADVTRNILTKLENYATDNSAYLSGGSSAPVIIPTPYEVPLAAENGVQSIEITIAEQQITDQVKVVGVIPFDIMYPVQGQYLDYVYDMRVERCQRQGILYTADCCSDMDELLYTPLNYDMPNILNVTQTSSQAPKQQVLIVTLPVTASTHVEKIAEALGLTPIMQFDDFYSSVEAGSAKVDGATYADLIRDIFGWSSRVPTQLINVYIRNGKLYVIQRGHEANVIDISDTEHTLPIVTHELVRTYWQRQKFSNTNVIEYKSNKRKPITNSSQVYSDGKSESDYDYDDEGLLQKSVTKTTNSDGDRIEIETSYKYETLASGKKILVKEKTKKYVNGKLEETTETRHTPLSQGLSHQVRTDEDGDIIGEGVGQNTSDDRVTPYSQYFGDDIKDTENVTLNTTIEGLTLVDTSFPIKTSSDIDDSQWEGGYPPSIIEAQQRIDPDKGAHRLEQITEALKWLNRRTKEIVTLSMYKFPHVIDFNDRVVLDGVEYFLVNNTARSSTRLYNEQNLTLVRWY